VLVLSSEHTIIISNLVFLLFASIYRVDVDNPLEIRIWLAYSIIHIFTFRIG